MKYKVGQIVKIKTVSVNGTDIDLRYSEDLKDVLAEVYEVWNPTPHRFGWVIVVKPSNIPEWPSVCLADNNFVLATDREAFLYYILGSKALRKEII